MAEIDTNAEAVRARLRWLRSDDGSDYQRDQVTADLLEAIAAQRDAAVARAEKAEGERDEAQRVNGQLDADRTLVKGRLQHSEYMNGIRVQQAKADADNIAKLQAQLTAALARVAELEGENEWRPIESAPKDESDLWLFEPPHDEGARPTQYHGCWLIRLAGWVSDDWRRIAPTHWRPLPAPPRKET